MSNSVLSNTENTAVEFETTEHEYHGVDEKFVSQSIASTINKIKQREKRKQIIKAAAVGAAVASASYCVGYGIGWCIGMAIIRAQGRTK